MAVFEVISYERIDDLGDLLDSDPKCVNAVAWHGISALQRAATKGNVEIIKLLLDRGADVNHRNAFGETALHFVCQAASLACVHLLIESGADVWIEDKAGRTCVHHAAKSGSIMKLHYLVAIGLPLTKRDNRGQTALHVAAEHGQEDLVEYLLRNERMETDVMDTSNAVPLHLAARNSHCEVAWTLESKSKLSQVSKEDIHGKTPVHYAAEGKTPRHIWLARNLKYWQHSRWTAESPPFPWLPHLVLLLLPSIWVLFLTLCANQLPLFFSVFMSVVSIVLFNLFIFRHHRIGHISALSNPAFLGFYFGLIVQSIGCYFAYLIPRLWPEFIWTFLGILLTSVTFITLKDLFADPGVVTSSRCSENGQVLGIMDVAKGTVPVSEFCSFCEIVRPQWVKHCRLCNVCVKGMDHHCLFLLHCVAKNNHRAFIFFMIETILANAMFLRTATTYLYSLLPADGSGSLREAMGKESYVTVLFFMNICGFVYVLFLLAFQFQVVSEGGTTFYSSKGTTVHRGFRQTWECSNVRFFQRVRNFVLFLLGKYTFIENMERCAAQRFEIPRIV